MKLKITLLFAAAMAAAYVNADDRHLPPAAAASAAPSAALSDGEIRKVDKDAKKITIRHGPLQNLDMPPMTMVFQIRDPALLEQVNAGDKVKFRAEKEGAAFVVTRIEAIE